MLVNNLRLFRYVFSILPLKLSLGKILKPNLTT